MFCFFVYSLRDVQAHGREGATVEEMPPRPQQICDIRDFRALELCQPGKEDVGMKEACPPGERGDAVWMGQDGGEQNSK